MIPSSVILANAGIPFAGGKVIASIWLLIPIILVEAGFIAYQFEIRYHKALSTSAIANIASTIVGIGAEYLLMGAVLHLHALPVLAGELVGGFFVTVLVEFFIVRESFITLPVSDIWKVTIMSNIVTYLLLIVVSFGVLFNYFSGRHDLKRSRTASDMRAIGTGLGSYQVDYKMYPQDDVVGMFTRLHELGYYSGSTSDGWNQIFLYLPNENGYTLMSYGKDMMAGAEHDEFDSDIVSHNGQFVAPSFLHSR